MKIIIIKISHYLMMCLMVLIFTTCVDDDSTRTDPLFSCCKNQALSGVLPGGIDFSGSILPPAHFYLPNVFTPNGDGVNDVFFVLGNSDLIREVDSLTISDMDGNEVFFNKWFDVNNSDEGWDGKVNGEIIKGIYDYEIKIRNLLGDKQVLTGKVCNFPCSESEKFATLDEAKVNCIFGTQHDGKGSFDSSRLHYEELDCLE